MLVMKFYCSNYFGFFFFWKLKLKFDGGYFSCWKKNFVSGGVKVNAVTLSVQSELCLEMDTSGKRWCLAE